MEKALKALKKHFANATSFSQIAANECHAQYYGFGYVEIVEKKGVLYANNSLPNGSYKAFVAMCDELEIKDSNRTYYRINKMLCEII